MAAVRFLLPALLLWAVLDGCRAQGIDPGVVFIEGNVNSFPECKADRPDGFCRYKDTTALGSTPKGSAQKFKPQETQTKSNSVAQTGGQVCQKLRISGFPANSPLNGDYDLQFAYENDLYEVISNNPFDRRQQAAASPTTYAYKLGGVYLYYIHSFKDADGKAEDVCQWLFGNVLGSTWLGWWGYSAVPITCATYTDPYPTVTGDPIPFLTSTSSDDWTLSTPTFECADTYPKCSGNECSTPGFVLKPSPTSIACYPNGCNERKCCDDCGAGIFVSGRKGRFNLINGLYTPQSNFNGKALYSRGKDATQVFLYFLPSKSVWAFSQTLGSENVLAMAPSPYGETPVVLNGQWMVWNEHGGYDLDTKIEVACYGAGHHHTPKDCSGQWEKIGACSLPCSTDTVVGQQLKEFQVNSPAAYGGNECETVDRDRKMFPCNTKKKCGPNCVGGWEVYRLCTKACGWGVTTMRYRVAKPAEKPKGHACEHHDGKLVTKPCFIQKCANGITSGSSLSSFSTSDLPPPPPPANP